MPNPGPGESDNLTDDLHGYIQRQLNEVIRGQQRLEAMVSKFAGVAMPNTPIESPYCKSKRSSKVEFHKAEKAAGDKLDRVTPRLQDRVTPRIQDAVANGAEAEDEKIIQTTSKLLGVEASRQSNVSAMQHAITEQLLEDHEAAQSVNERRRDRLKKIVMINRRQKEKEAQNRSSVLKAWKDKPCKSCMHFVMREELLDAVMGVVIFANAIFIGISLDHKDGNNFDAWLLTDLVFAGAFILELGVKIALHGGVSHFTGKDKFSNCFDTIIIALDGVQLWYTFHHIGKETHVRSASVFRIIRLMRMVRLVRILKLEGMKTFVDMLQGILDGAQTLFWAIVMFVLMVYGGGVLCKICFGSETFGQKEKITNDYFDTIPRAMMTVFRCSFGDCSTIGGTPIPEFILQEKGTEYALGYCLFMFFITIGLFNIISAIFVDSTMNLSASVATKTKLQRLSDHTLWSVSVATIIGELLARHKEGLTLEQLEDDFDTLANTEFNRIEIDAIVSGKNGSALVLEALDNLDIDTNDHKRLSDILDPDHSGTITVLELIEGLRRLRGDPRRSDVVSVDLMIRSLQQKQDEILAELLNIKATEHKENKAIEKFISEK